MNEITILDKVKNAIYLCEEQGRHPILILMNWDTRRKFLDIENGEKRFCTSITQNGKEELFGLEIIVCNVKDFLIIDDKNWYEQVF